MLALLLLLSAGVGGGMAQASAMITKALSTKWLTAKYTAGVRYGPVLLLPKPRFNKLPYPRTSAPPSAAAALATPPPATAAAATAAAPLLPPAPAATVIAVADDAPPSGVSSLALRSNLNVKFDPV